MASSGSVHDNPRAAKSGSERHLRDWRRQKFLEWLCTLPEDRDPPTQKELSAQLDVSPNVLAALKKSTEFLREWEVLYMRTVGSPEKRQRVVDTLFETATDRTDPRLVPAARAFLEAVDAIKPKKMEVKVSKDPKSLTDEELAGILAEKAEREQENRGAEAG